MGRDHTFKKAVEGDRYSACENKVRDLRCPGLLLLPNGEQPQPPILLKGQEGCFVTSSPFPCSEQVRRRKSGLPGGRTVCHTNLRL